MRISFGRSVRKRARLAAPLFLGLAVLLQGCGEGGWQIVPANDSGTEPTIGEANESAVNFSELLTIHTEAEGVLEFRVRAVNSREAGAWSEYMPLTSGAENFADISVEEEVLLDDSLLPAVSSNGELQLIQWPYNIGAEGFEVQIKNVDDEQLVYEASMDAKKICDFEQCQLITAVKQSPVNNIAPFAALTGSSFEGVAPFNLQVSAENSIDLDGEIASYQWYVRGMHIDDVGGNSFNYSFENPGEYELVVVVTDEQGGRASGESSFVVLPMEQTTGEIIEPPDVETTESMAPPVPSVVVSTKEELENSGVLEPAEETDSVATPVAVPEILPEPEVDTADAGDYVDNLDSVDSSDGPVSSDTPFVTESAPQLVLISELVDSITFNSAAFRWQLDNFATGQIEYGTTEALGSWSTKESSYRYDGHVQQLTGLKSGTQYFYRLDGSTEAGAILQSEMRSFTTLVATQPEPVVAAASPGSSDSSDGAVSSDTPVVTELAPQLALISELVDSITSNSAAFRWQLDNFATGQIEYGTTEALGSWSKKESSFRYDGHVQQLTGLKSGTQYFYRLHGSTVDGATLQSEIQTFTTLIAPDSKAVSPQPPVDSSKILVSDDWPATGVNENLPMGGLFYGNGLSGRGVQNAQVSAESSRRFRAEKTGELVSYTYHNRLLRDSEIIYRCDAYGESSVWCKCKNAGLDENLCGYTLGNSYHVGNGGTIVVELRPDDGTGKPSDVVLGKTEQFIPTENRDQWFATLQFVSPAPIKAGGIYHLVHTNLTPPTVCVGYTQLAEAAKCSRNEGAQGLNGSRSTSYSTTTGRWGPFRGDKGAATLVKRTARHDWVEFEKSVSYYEVGYSDGVSTGDTYHSYDAVNTQQTIEGNTLARQIFTVEDMSREVNGIWLLHGHRKGSNGNGLDVELKDGNGAVIATAKLGASAYCRNLADNDSELPCRDWAYADLDRSVSLLQGSKYSVDFSGAKGSGFILSTYETLNFGIKDRNQWRNARGEFSTDNGSRWNVWGTQGGSERDMALLFTIVGMPKQLK